VNHRSHIIALGRARGSDEWARVSRQGEETCGSVCGRHKLYDGYVARERDRRRIVSSESNEGPDIQVRQKELEL
jgi:hypothetical protein